MPGIWTSLTSHHAIFWPIDRIFRRGSVISRRPEITALLTGFPRATMFILIVGVAQTQAFVLDLTPPAASKRHKGRIATDPLLTTRRLHQRCRCIATEATMRAGNRLRFHAVLRHGGSCVSWRGWLSHPSYSLARCITQLSALSSRGSWSSQP